jgi:choline-sulfatase
MEAMAPRNILIVMADQLNPFAVGCYGSAVARTPNIDRLAEQGIRFDAAYSSSPLCTPARYAFMTGRYVSRCGGYDNAAYLPSTVATFAHYLRMMGYRTSLSGKMHFIGPDQLHGFEERLTTDIYPADFGWVPDWTRPDERINLWYHNMSSVVQAGVAATTSQLAFDEEVGTQALRAIYEHARGMDERPLCLVASFTHPHDPYATPQRFWDLYDDIEIPMPNVPRPAADDNDPHSRRLEKVIALDAVDMTDEDVRRARRAYFANTSYVDHWLGRLRDALEECGIADDTAVLFLSDHGDMLGERGLWYKMSLYEWSVRIPMVLYRPGDIGGRAVGAPVSHLDVLPTLMRLAAEATGAEMPEAVDPLDGKDLLAVAERNDVEDGVAISEYLGEGTGQALLMIRRGQWKYTCCPGDPEQLFDLASDPDELDNLARDDEQSQRISWFRAHAATHWDVGAVREAVLDSQRRRRILSAALRQGRYENWEWQPFRDATEEYTRSHMDVAQVDITSRWPRPKPFEPKWK